MDKQFWLQKSAKVADKGRLTNELLSTFLLRSQQAQPSLVRSTRQRTRQEFILSDPSIKSMEQIYGNTDIGQMEIHAILRGHHCGRICKLMGLARVGAPLVVLGR